MGRNAKAGTNWELAKIMWEAGEGPTAIAEKMGVTRQAVSQRAKRHGWQQTQVNEGAPSTWLDQVKDMTPVGYKDTPESRAIVLQCLSKGISKTKAAEYAGVLAKTVNDWIANDETFAAQVAQVQREWHETRMDRLESASKRGDIKADMFLLQTHDGTKDQYAPKGNQGSGGIHVYFNWDRDTPPPTIDVTPDD